MDTRHLAEYTGAVALRLAAKFLFANTAGVLPTEQGQLYSRGTGHLLAGRRRRWQLHECHVVLALDDVGMQGLEVVTPPRRHRNTRVGATNCHTRAWSGKGNHALVVMAMAIVVLSTPAVVNPAVYAAATASIYPWQMQTRLAAVAKATSAGRSEEITPYPHGRVSVGRPYRAGTCVHRKGPFMGIQARLKLAETGSEAFIKFPFELFLHTKRKKLGH